MTARRTQRGAGGSARGGGLVLRTPGAASVRLVRLPEAIQDGLSHEIRLPVQVSREHSARSELAQSTLRVPGDLRRFSQREQPILPHAGRLYAPSIGFYQHLYPYGKNCYTSCTGRKEAQPTNRIVVPPAVGPLSSDI